MPTRDFLAGGQPGHGEAAAGDHLQSAYRLWLPGHQIEQGTLPVARPVLVPPGGRAAAQSGRLAVRSSLLAALAGARRRRRMERVRAARAHRRRPRDVRVAERARARRGRGARGRARVRGRPVPARADRGRPPAGADLGAARRCRCGRSSARAAGRAGGSCRPAARSPPSPPPARCISRSAPCRSTSRTCSFGRARPGRSSARSSAWPSRPPLACSCGWPRSTARSARAAARCARSDASPPTGSTSSSVTTATARRPSSSSAG